MTIRGRPGLRAGLIAAVGALTLWAAPGAEAALNVSYTGSGNLLIAAGPGEINDVYVQKVIGSDNIYVQESTAGVGVNAPACFQPAVYAAECGSVGVTKVLVRLGSEPDSLEVPESSWPADVRVSAKGEGGADELQTATGADLVNGGPGRDTLLAGAGKDKVLAKDGKRDTSIDCGAGKDTLKLDLGLDPAPISC
jgi:Ca2+-binding RTX toxin-like protein